MRAAALHICSRCNSDLVHPVDWEEEAPGLWYVTLRCPECEWRVAGVYPQEVVDRFEEALERGTDVLVSELKTLVLENYTAELNRSA